MGAVEWNCFDSEARPFCFFENPVWGLFRLSSRRVFLGQCLFFTFGWLFIFEVSWLFRIPKPFQKSCARLEVMPA